MTQSTPSQQLNAQATPLPSTISPEAIKKVESYRWVVYGILALCYFFVSFHRMAAGIIKSDMATAFGIGATEFSILSACYFYTYTLLQIPAGILADTLGAKKTVAGGMLVAALGTVIFGLAPNITLAYIGRALVGAGVAVVFIPILVIQTQWFYTKDFGVLTGLTGAVSSLGGISAQTPLLLLVGAVGWRNSFLAVGAVTVALFFLVLAFVKKNPQEMGLPSIADIEGRPTPAAGEKIKVLASLKSIGTNPLTWIPTAIAAGLMGAFLTFAGTWGVSLIAAKFGLDKVAATNGNLVVLLAMGIGGTVIGKLSDRYKNRKIFITGLSALYALAWFLMIYVEVPQTLFYPFMFFVGIGSNAFILTWALSKEYNDPKVAGMATAFINTFGFAASAIFPVIIGRSLEAYGNALTFAHYAQAFRWMPWMLAGVVVLSLFLKETHGENIYTKLKG